MFSYDEQINKFISKKQYFILWKLKQSFLWYFSPRDYYFNNIIFLINFMKIIIFDWSYTNILGVIIYPPEISGGFFFDKVVIFNVRFFTPYICI